jgi:O-antigen/teichoic acid export membrane protein
MSKRRVFANLLVLGTNQIATWLISMVSLVLIGRYLGPTGLGVLSLAGAAVGVAGILASLGMDIYVVRTVARSPERASELVSAVLAVRLGLMAPILASLYAYTVVAHVTTDTQLVTFFLAISMVISGLASPLVAAMQGRERMGFPALMSFLVNLLELGVVILVIEIHGGVVLFAGLWIPIAAGGTILNVLWAGRFARISLRTTRKAIEEVVRGGLAFWTISIFATFYLYIDSIILGSLAGTAAVGIYAPATRLLSVGLFLPGIVASATLPLLSRLGVDAAGDFLRVGRQTLTFLLVSAVPLTIGLATFGGYLITTIYGPGYQASIPVLVALSFCIPPIFLNIQANQTLVAQDQQWRWTIVMVLGCVINPALNFALIPFAEHNWHNGALGAAVAFLVSEVLMTGYAIVVLRRMLFHTTVIRALLGCLIAGLAQIALLWLCGGFWPPLAEAVALAGFTTLAVAFGALPRSDIMLLFQIAQGKRGRSVKKDEVPGRI